MSKELTVDQLIKDLQELQAQGLGSWKVVVPVVESSIGPSACVGVATVTGGFDWNTGRVFLGTVDSVKRVSE